MSGSPITFRKRHDTLSSQLQPGDASLVRQFAGIIDQSRRSGSMQLQIYFHSDAMDILGGDFMTLNGQVAKRYMLEQLAIYISEQVWANERIVAHVSLVGNELGFGRAVQPQKLFGSPAYYCNAVDVEIICDCGIQIYASLLTV
jgi:hypothetical protein